MLRKFLKRKFFKDLSAIRLFAQNNKNGDYEQLPTEDEVKKGVDIAIDASYDVFETTKSKMGQFKKMVGLEED